MQKPVSFSKPALDLLFVQLTWTFWFLGIVLLINIGKIIIGTDVDSFYSVGYLSSNIYMLVIGIIAINFMPYYVENGITRKNYFLGNASASIGLAIILPVFVFVINFIEKFIVSNFTSKVLNAHSLDEVIVDIDGNLIGEVIQSIIITPFIHPESNLLLSLALFSLNIFVFYIVGWMISSAFYRLGAIAGIIFIVIGVVFISIKDSMIRLTLDIPLFESFSSLDIIPNRLALPVVFIVILLTILLIRLLTKRAVIKI